MMEFSLKEWIAIIVGLIAIGSNLYVWFNSSGKKASDALADYKKINDPRVADHSERLQALEVEARHTPNSDQIHQLELLISELRGDNKELRQMVTALSDNLQTMTAALGQMREFMLKIGVPK